MKVIESQNDTPKTPSLRQFAKERPEAVPPRSFITTIFTPGKYSGYAFVTEHGFKVTLSIGSESNATVERVIEDCQEDGAALFVVVEDGGRGLWHLFRDDLETTSIEQTSWGFRCEIGKPRSKKKPTQRT